MPEIMGNIPYMRCMVRGEYLRNMATGDGEFIEAIAYGVRCVRGSSLFFQCALGSPYGGVHFLLPIEALCWKECERPKDVTQVQPFDCFSHQFGVVEFDFIKRGEAYVLPDRIPAQYQWTIDWTGTDIADDLDQHKHLHVVKIENGWVGAFANNRLLMPDKSYWPMLDDLPKFESLAGEFRAEGNQHLFRPQKQAETLDQLIDRVSVGRAVPAKATSKAATNGNGHEYAPHADYTSIDDAWKHA